MLLAVPPTSIRLPFFSKFATALVKLQGDILLSSRHSCLMDPKVIEGERCIATGWEGVVHLLVDRTRDQAEHRDPQATAQFFLRVRKLI